MIALIGEQHSKTGSIGEKFPDGQTGLLLEPFASFVIDGIFKYIFVSKDLRNIVTNDFEDPERIRHKQTMLVAIIAIEVSLLLGLWGIFMQTITG